MPDASDIAETIAEVAADGVESASQDGRTATSFPIPDLIAAEKHTAGKEAVSGTNPQGGSRSLWGSLRPARAVPPGGV